MCGYYLTRGTERDNKEHIVFTIFVLIYKQLNNVHIMKAKNADNGADMPILPVGDAGAISPMSNNGGINDDNDIPTLTPTSQDVEVDTTFGGDNGGGDNDPEVGVVNIDDEDYDVDEDGNAIDEDGEIVFTAQELDEMEEAGDGGGEGDGVYDDERELIEIDGDTYYQGEDGSAEDEDGNVIYTAEDLDNMTEDHETSVSDLIELSEMQTIDEDGQPLEYENTDEGRRKYIEDIYEAGGLNEAQKIIDARETSYPLIKLASDYIITNGSLDGFNEAEFSEVVVTNDTAEQDLVAVIRQARLMKGDSETEVAQAISWAKSDNKLYDLAKSSEEFLSYQGESKKNQMADAAVAKEESQAAANDKYVDDVSALVEQGSLEIDGQRYTIPKVFEIPTGDGRRGTIAREDLISYGTELLEWQMPDGSKQVATRYQIDIYNSKINRTVNDDLLDMINMISGNSNVFLQEAVQSERANRVSKKLKSTKARDTRRHSKENSAGDIILPGHIH